MAGSVLVVEREPQAGSLLRGVLAEDGYDVRVAPTARAAMAALGEGLPDLVLLGPPLADGDGFEVARELERRAGGRGVPLVLLTDDPEPRRQARWLGAAAYLPRAVAPADLRARVARTLDTADRMAAEDLRHRARAAEQLRTLDEVRREMAHRRARAVRAVGGEAGEAAPAAGPRGDLADPPGAERAGALLAAAAHELRAPLAVMVASAELLRSERRYDERMVEVVLRQGRRLGRLLDGLQDSWRAGGGRLRLRRARVDLAALARDVAGLAGAPAPGRPPRVEAPAGPVWGRWDRDRLEQVLWNLLANAAKYGPAGGEVTVRVEDLGAGARVAVADEGPGIPPEDLPRVFDRFYRTPAAEGGGARGLGLRLYISKALVEAHGGRIWAESRPGGGSTFAFTLPYGAPEGD
jgi:signal transduction histidine kinase